MNTDRFPAVLRWKTFDTGDYVYLEKTNPPIVHIAK